MSTAVLSLLFSVVTAQAPATYTDAYQAATADESRPLVVLVGAEWCPACQMMKHTVMPQVQQRGSLQNVAFATVNTDEQGALAGQLMEGGTIPQLVMYTKTRRGWLRRRLTGGQSIETVESFIASGRSAPTSDDVTTNAKPAEVKAIH